MEDLDQYQDPVADAALGHHGEDEAKEHQDNAATVAATATLDDESDQDDAVLAAVPVEDCD